MSTATARRTGHRRLRSPLAALAPLPTGQEAAERPSTGPWGMAPTPRAVTLANFLQREYGHPSPYTAGLSRYAEVTGRPKTLSGEFVDDLLEATGGGKARDFETARDHAIIRILRGEGIRRQELLSMVMHTLPADLIKNPVFRLVSLKGIRRAQSAAWFGSSR